MKFKTNCENLIKRWNLIIIIRLSAEKKQLDIKQNAKILLQIWMWFKSFLTSKISFNYIRLLIKNINFLISAFLDFWSTWHKLLHLEYLSENSLLYKLNNRREFKSGTLTSRDFHVQLWDYLLIRKEVSVNSHRANENYTKISLHFKSPWKYKFIVDDWEKSADSSRNLSFQTLS